MKYFSVTLCQNIVRQNSFKEILMVVLDIILILDILIMLPIYGRIMRKYLSKSMQDNLKELKNCNHKLILCPPQNRRKHNQHFIVLFFITNLHFVKSD